MSSTSLLLSHLQHRWARECNQQKEEKLHTRILRGEVLLLAVAANTGICLKRRVEHLYGISPIQWILAMCLPHLFNSGLTVKQSLVIRGLLDILPLRRESLSSVSQGLLQQPWHVSLHEHHQAVWLPYQWRPHPQWCSHVQQHYDLQRA